MNEKLNEEKEVPKVSEKSLTPEKSKIRQIVIETDGNMVRIIKNETAGSLELVSMLSMLLSNLTSRKK